ncbi:MAG: FprA family A-type flavoprotein [Anaerovoracaceae bacterium]|nr:FprA family A-type flavoprotein [Anaerovoracaceae bacterium]
MYCVRKVSDDVFYVGGDDRRLALFENIHPIPSGVSYNSYVLLDESTVLVDTADWAIGRQFISNVEHALAGRGLDYVVVNHVEPDHAAMLEEVLLRWPSAKVIATAKAFTFLEQFDINVAQENRIPVKEGDTQSFGKHEFTFVTANMVHWPEVMVSFDTSDGTLYSADAFGTFGALGGKLFADEFDFDHDLLDDARNYYCNIVGKYGAQTQKLLEKASGLDINMICPLHGPVWRKDMDVFIDKYDKWSTYTPEDPDDAVIFYASMYGGTESAAQFVSQRLNENGTDARMYDVSSTPVTTLVGESFRAGKIIIASVTYNFEIFPKMQDFLSDIKMLGLKNRTVGIMYNGTWAPRCGALLRDFFTKDMKDINIVGEDPYVKSAATASDEEALTALADEIAKA